MHRKQFLSALVPATLALSSFKAGGNNAVKPKLQNLRIPPYLKPGDTIGITSPAGYISLEDVQPAVQLMQSWGFKIEMGKTVGKRDFTMGGTADERTDDLQYMLNNPNIKAIMCARGGYGVVQIIDRLSFTQFKAHPKWVIGFSDITVLHNHIHTNCHVATLHSKMCNSFPADWNKAEPIQIETILSIKQALTGEKLQYNATASAFNRMGKVSAPLVGGNLSLVANLTGTPSDLDTRGKILFLEDTGEYLYNIDRMLYNLKRSGKLSHLAGLIIGGFKVKAGEADDAFGKTIYDIVLDKVKPYQYPVCFDFPVGHQKNNFALKCGTLHTLEVGGNGTILASV
ncbi:LD-carboxypeptidase [Mucilaginibacter sp. PAMB04274]|uniref:S66 peptidase family protein n=1 Tax=Mucilaginibacter sp. PAMB04274 TaxID=3138568 RepID=UPI0031F6C0C2